MYFIYKYTLAQMKGIMYNVYIADGEKGQVVHFDKIVFPSCRFGSGMPILKGA